MESSVKPSLRNQGDNFAIRTLYLALYQNVYFTDANSYGSAGYLYGYTKEGQQVFAPQKVYVNPAHILALPIYENK